jgi:hypothetical protein
MLVKQRVSVPELSNQKFKNYSILLFAIILISSLIMIFLFNDIAIVFTKNINLIDNIFNIIFMLSAFLFSYYNFEILNRLSLREKPIDYKIIYYKKFILISMFSQKMSYIINYILISYYHPIIYSEKILLSSLIIIINFNCIAFYFLFAFFIFTLKYDIYYVNLQLQLIPEIEFFTDDNEYNNKYLSKEDLGKFVEI